MCPFPNEDLIRTKMKAYNADGVSGNRRFCADGQTLTSYIWGYLGNDSPYGGDRQAKEVIVLSRLRDEILMKNFFGRWLVNFYYKASPKLAAYIGHKEFVKKFLRIILRPIIDIAQKLVG